MEIKNKKLYSRQEMAGLLCEDIKNNYRRLIGVTGTSCVGKSSFTSMIKNELEKQFSVQVINVDSYLKEEYRAGQKFWKAEQPFLTPQHFEWKALNEDSEKMLSGNHITKQVYIRGVGWDAKMTYQPADVIILEGLFLDSVEASGYMKYDLLIALAADDEMIQNARMKRDDYYREHFKDFTRTKEETLQEAEKTLKAGKSYTVCKDKWNCVRMKVQEDFQMKVMENQ